MSHQANQKLSIVIPTYNRSDFIQRFLEVHIPLASKNCIGIFISDNCSSDNTAEVVRAWMLVYPFLYYSCNDSNLGPDGNFEVALNLPKTEYVWLFGDTYRVPDNGFSYVLSLVAGGSYPVVVTNHLVGKVDLPAKEYADIDELLSDIGGIMSCLSSLIFNRDLIVAASFFRYRDSSFIHTGIALEYIARHTSIVYWAGDLQVLPLSGKGLTKKSWIDTLQIIEVGVEKWVNFIFSLPPQYSLLAKLQAVRSFGFLGWRSLMLMRANGFLTPNVFARYKKSFGLAVDSEVKYFALFIICRLPVSLVKVAVGAFRRLRVRGNA